MKQDTIHINGLSIGYHSKSSTKLVAKGIHSTIYSGELTCLLGANGVPNRPKRSAAGCGAA